MLRSRVLVFLVGLVLGGIAGAGGMLIAFPFLFPPPVAADPAPAVDAAAPALAFRFDEKAPGRDPIHWADGTGRIVRTAQGWMLRFEGDFRAGPGPNFWVYLNTAPVGEEKDFRADAGRVRVAPIKSFTGAQNFMLPAGLDPAKFHTVTIWCESFGVYIGSAAIGK